MTLGSPQFSYLSQVKTRHVVQERQPMIYDPILDTHTQSVRQEQIRNVQDEAVPIAKVSTSTPTELVQNTHSAAVDACEERHDIGSAQQKQDNSLQSKFNLMNIPGADTSEGNNSNREVFRTVPACLILFVFVNMSLCLCIVCVLVCVFVCGYTCVYVCVHIICSYKSGESPSYMSRSPSQMFPYPGVMKHVLAMNTFRKKVTIILKDFLINCGSCSDKKTVYSDQESNCDQRKVETLVEQATSKEFASEKQQQSKPSL